MKADRHKNTRNSLARARWRFLAESLRKNKVDQSEGACCTTLESSSSSSTRQFKSFGLLNIIEIKTDDEARQVGTPSTSLGPGTLERDWVEISCDYSQGQNHQPVRVLVSVLPSDQSVSLAAVKGFNNTGNICIWPAEEVMAYHCLKTELPNLTGKKVAELGGGMTCLAGLLVGATGAPHSVHLSDGNQMSAGNLDLLVHTNAQRGLIGAPQHAEGAPAAPSTIISSSLMRGLIAAPQQDPEGAPVAPSSIISSSLVRWDDAATWPTSLVGKCDVILAADCFFFEDHHGDLAKCIHGMLNAEGTALCFAPQRGGSLDRFVTTMLAMFKDSVQVTVTKDYNSHIVKLHEANLKQYSKETYCEDRHFPLMARIAKITNNAPIILKDSDLIGD